MRIIFFGTPHFVTPVLESLMKHFKVIAVVTAPDRKAGRKQLLTPSPIKAYAQDELYKSGKNAEELPIFTPNNLSTLNAQLSALKPDLFVVAAYGYILPEEVLTIPPFGAVNVHPSLLPKYRGPTPVPTTLLNGDTVSGVTIIKMDDKMDHGPILSMQSYAVHTTDTTETLLNHLFSIAAEMLPDVITQYTSGKLQSVQQDESKATYTHKIEKADGFIDLNNPPDMITLNRMIQAYYPWPAVWTTTKIKDHEARIKFLPGGKVQMEGKNPVSIRDFLNGYPEIVPLLKKLTVRE